MIWARLPLGDYGICTLGQWDLAKNRLRRDSMDVSLNSRTRYVNGFQNSYN